MTTPWLVGRDGACLEKLSQLHAQSFKEAWRADAIAGLLDNDGTFALAAGPSSDPCGFVMARVVVDEAEILTIAVAPSWRRGGVGRCLLVAAAWHAAGKGALAMFLEVGVENQAARALYEGLGFRAVGQRKSYYGDGAGRPPQDALTLRADLPLRPLGKALETD